MTKLIFPKIENFWLCFILILLSSCIDEFNRELYSSQKITVGGFEVEEKIYRTDSFPDAVFERLYAASGRNVSLDLGRFEDESSTGIVHSPIVQNNQLIVFSSAHVFFWRPGEEPHQFNPFEAEGWYEYAQQDRLNGHYDYLAKAVWEHDKKTLLKYECDSCETGKPKTLLFFSLDGGQTFDICLTPAPDYSTCLD